MGGQAAGAWQGVAEGREVPPDGRSVSARALDPSPLCFRSPRSFPFKHFFFFFSYVKCKSLPLPNELIHVNNLAECLTLRKCSIISKF